MLRTVGGLALVFTAVLLACSSDETTGGSSSSSSGSQASSSSSSSGAATATVKAPTLDSVAKMSGSLHVMWTNNQTDCDSIELERQAKMADGSVMEKYKVAYTLTGDIDNKHDTSATADMDYSYRARCKKGSTYSDYSNEKSGNPLK